MAGRFVQEHCQVLHDAGFDVTVFTLRRGGRHDRSAWPVIEVGWVPASVSLFGTQGAPDALEARPWRVLEAPAALGALVTAALRQPAPDLWLGHWLVPGGLAARTCGRLTDVPSLVVGHSGGVHLLNGLVEPLRSASIAAVASGPTTVPTMALARELGREVDILPMGFRPVEPAGPRSEDVLCFGRLVPIKGFDVVPDAVRGLGLTVQFAGDGPLRRPLHQACRRAGVRALFHGWVGPPEKPAIFGRADIAMFPSRVMPDGRHEGWPVSVLEVSAAGVVPFVADWPGARELVVEPLLQVVRAGAWRDAVMRWRALGEQERAKLRRRVRDHARSFTWEALGPAWIGRVVDAAHGT